MLSFGITASWGPERKMATVLIRRTQAAKHTEQSGSPQGWSRRGTLVPDERKITREGQGEAGGAELFSNLEI